MQGIQMAADPTVKATRKADAEPSSSSTRAFRIGPAPVEDPAWTRSWKASSHSSPRPHPASSGTGRRSCDRFALASRPSALELEGSGPESRAVELILHTRHVRLDLG